MAEAIKQLPGLIMYNLFRWFFYRWGNMEIRVDLEMLDV